MERGNLFSGDKGKVQVRLCLIRPGTDTENRGGTACSSDEAGNDRRAKKQSCSVLVMYQL